MRAAPSTIRRSFRPTSYGANAVSPTGLERSETQFNYFVGPKENWRSGVTSYQVVAYEGLYDGVDLYTRGQRDSLKYEFHVAPGADYRQIQVQYEGIEGLSVERRRCPARQHRAGRTD